jgi:hypothetical protein
LLLLGAGLALMALKKAVAWDELTPVKTQEIVFDLAGNHE